MTPLQDQVKAEHWHGTPPHRAMLHALASCGYSTYEEAQADAESSDLTKRKRAYLFQTKWSELMRRRAGLPTDIRQIPAVTRGMYRGAGSSAPVKRPANAPEPLPPALLEWARAELERQTLSEPSKGGRPRKRGPAILVGAGAEE